MIIKRLTSLIVGLIVSVSVFLVMWNFDHEWTSKESLQILIRVFSILAGVLIAMIALDGDPRGLWSDNWRIASMHRHQIKNRMKRYVLLFYVYLIFIALVFCMSLFSEIGVSSFAKYSRICEILALSVGCGALVWSFGVPGAIIKTHMQRLDEAVRKQRESPGVD